MSKKSSKQTRSNRRHSQVETLEAREVMSADPLGGLLGGAISHHSIQEDAPPLTQHGSATLTQPGGVDYSHRADPNADFWLDEQPHVSLEEQLEQIEKSLSSAHQLTGMDDVKANYGFSGIGQTVAVIDSGIAYDHYALGGGLGSNYRVVGGYDFTESDSDPYDDGTEGSHGTHVAGIVGANDGDRSGVAPGVDLVGLRVFSDNGAGYFSWVESALQWVHDNRNAFENPITAVNLSLGTSWNANTIPAWAMLENEFAQLEADGIFISVSAGNSYTTYNEPGLSYPAASPYVVPVMSSDDSGFLSYFSQRHERAIAAPGRYIYSTVPDYAGNNNGVTDDWANFSGTSMAAPYVAGASVIIREAMEFVGMTGITQDSIYDHMIATADSFTDSATGALYNRLNVQAAIDALMPEDDFGSSVADAYNLGTINAGPQASAGPMSGHIERLNDADYFTFTAGATGTVTFAAQNTTHQLAASWDGMGADGWSSDGGASYTLNVVAGQQYTVALSSSDGLGYYDLSFSAESTFTYTDWGATGVQETKSGINIAGDTFYRIQAGRDGYVTVVALQAAGITGIELLDSNLLAVGSAANGRADYYAQAGEELYLKVSGTATGVSFRLTNAVSVSGSTVTMQGTDGADILRSYAGQQTHRLSLNGVLYAFSASSHTNLEINGAGGIDTIVAYGSSQNETALLGVGSGSVRSSTYTLTVSRTESIVVIGGGGFDTAFLYGSGGADKYRSYGDRAVMEGQGYYNRADLYDISYGFANGADDIAYMYGSDGDDQYRSYSDRAVMSGSGYYNRAIGFASTWGYGDSPGDAAWMYGSAGDDEYRTSSTHSLMTGDGFSNCAVYFEETVGWADSAGDQAWMYGSSGADVFSAYSDRVEVTGAGFSTIARNFARTYEFANHSGDVANLYGTAGADQVRAYEDRTLIAGSGYYSRAIGFTTTNVFGGGGADVVHLEDGLGDDAVAAEAWGAYLEYASGVRVEVRDCESIIARGVNGGVNTVDENPVDYYFEKIGDWI